MLLLLSTKHTHTHAQVGELAEAEECFSKAVEMWRRDHEEVVMSAENLSRVREKRLATREAKEEADDMSG